MHLTKPISSGPTLKTWTRDEYYRLAECGRFQSERTELIGGRIYVVSPQQFAHSIAVYQTTKALERIFCDGFWVRSQLPLHLDDMSEPEPDVSVAAGDPASFSDHPTAAVLIVEVSNSSLAIDRTEKAGLYASAGIEDYWIVNLVDGVLEVHRDPVADQQQPFGHTYRSVRTLQPTDAVSPLASPDAAILVRDLLSAQQ